MILAGSCLFFGLAFGKYKRLYNEIRMDCLPAQQVTHFLTVAYRTALQPEISVFGTDGVVKLLFFQMFEEDVLPENTTPIPISTMMPFEEYVSTFKKPEHILLVLTMFASTLKVLK